MKIKFRKFSTKGKLVLLSGALVLMTGAGYAVGKNTNKKNSTETTTESTSTIDNNIETDVIDIVEISELDKYYNEINTIKSNVVMAINDGLVKSMYDYDLTEDMKDKIAQTYLDYYLMMNKSQISGLTFDILNQDKDMSAIEIMNNSLTQEQLIQEQTIISEEGIALNYDNIILEETDKNFISNLADIIASMHTAVDNNNNKELDSLAQKVIEIKEEIVKNNAQNSMLYNPMTIDLTIMLIDAADSLYNGKIITDDEDLNQIFNTSYVKCINGSYVSTLTNERVIALASELKVEEYQKMSREEILEAISLLNAKGVSEVSIRSNLRTISKNLMAETIQNTEKIECDETYSYKNLIQSIKEQIDLSLQVRPEKDYLKVLNENPYGPNKYKETSKKDKKTTEYVKENKVPNEKRVPTTEQFIDEETKKETNETYLKAKTAAITAGSADAAATYKNSYCGHAEDMPKKAVGNEPSLDCKDYNTVYTYFYNLEWNNSRNSFIKAEKKARNENEKTTSEYKEIDGTEEIISETEPKSVEKNETEKSNNTTEEEFIPIDGGEEIEIDSTIEDLVRLKNDILSNYVYAYNDTNENIRKM